MKKLILTAAVVVALFSVNAMAQVNFGLKSAGAHLGFVMPEDPIDNTIGFGIQSEFGSFKVNNLEFTFGAFINYWSKTYGDPTVVETTYSETTFAPFVHYNLAMDSKFQPYVGGGFGFARNSADFKSTNVYLGATSYSTSDTDFIFFGLAGAKMAISPMLEGFSEVRYQLGDIDVFSINVGVNYLLGK